ncbi:MAG: hypothetical protein HKN23_17865, partial [Verrucomicrobiales bacterium]|nr:hypothetical protein [Verrucomicrobiales bacterium]
MNVRFAFACLLPVLAFAEHGGTKKWEEKNREIREQFAGKITNENVPVFWSKDGTSSVFHLEIEPGKREWRSLDLASGKITELGKKPDDTEKSAKQPPKDKPEKGTPPALESRRGWASYESKHTAEL